MKHGVSFKNVKIKLKKKQQPLGYAKYNKQYNSECFFLHYSGNLLNNIVLAENEFAKHNNADHDKTPQYHLGLHCVAKSRLRHICRKWVKAYHLSNLH